MDDDFDDTDDDEFDDLDFEDDDDADLELVRKAVDTAFERGRQFERQRFDAMIEIFRRLKHDDHGGDR